jgi:hypothetical protein
LAQSPEGTEKPIGTGRWVERRLMRHWRPWHAGIERAHLPRSALSADERATLPVVANVIFDEVVHTDYGQFDLIWGNDFGFDGDFDRFFDGQVNGLAGAASGEGLYLILARRSGGSPVQIVLHDSEPPLLEDWEDVVEVSILLPAAAEPTWSTWAGETSDSLPIPHGTYRVRVNARGRDAGRDGEFADEPVDWYLIELWPAPTQVDTIVRTTTTDAAYWHKEVGSRR